MQRSTPATLSILALAALLPGCLVANAALGVMGLLGPPAVQLAGAAYTVAEYSYEYSVNDRTPDEVIAAKLEWIFPTGNDPSLTEYASAFRRTVTAGAAPLPTPAAAREIAPPVVVRTAQAGTRPAPLSAAGAKPGPRTTSPDRTPSKRTAEAAPPAKRSPVRHAYVRRDPNPLQERLHRLEQGLRQAEALYLADRSGDLRLSVPPPEGDPSGQGVSGSWSIRHPVMKTAPEPVARPAQSTADSSRSLNT